MRMRIILVAFLLLIAAAASAALPTLTGKVMLQTADGKKSALSEARVELAGASGGPALKAFSDTNGRYAFFNVPAGTYSLRVFKGSGELKVLQPAPQSGRSTLTVTDPATPLPGLEIVVSQ